MCVGGRVCGWVGGWVCGWVGGRVCSDIAHLESKSEFNPFGAGERGMCGGSRVIRPRRKDLKVLYLWNIGPPWSGVKGWNQS